MIQSSSSLRSLAPGAVQSEAMVPQKVSVRPGRALLTRTQSLTASTRAGTVEAVGAGERLDPSSFKKRCD